MSISPLVRARWLLVVSLVVTNLPGLWAQSGWTLSRINLPEVMSVGGIAYGNGRFVVTLFGSSVVPPVAWSTDGVTWTPGRLQGAESSAIVFVGGQFYLAKGSTVYRSVDGDAWQEVATLASGYRASLLATDGRALLVGSNLDGWKPLYHSADRVAFRATAALPGGAAPNLGQVDYLGAAGGRFFVRAAMVAAGGSSGGPIVVATADGGATWQNVAAIPSTNFMASGNGRLMAYGAISTNGGATFADTISTTTDGVGFTHTPRPLLLGDGRSITGGRNLAYAGGRFFFLGTLYASTDGVAWATLAAGPAEDAGRSLAGIAYGNGRYVAVGTSTPSTPPFRSTDVVATLVAAAAVPVLATAPADRTVPAGSPLTLSVAVEGSAAGLTYQWRRDGVAIAGATAATYAIAAFRPADAGLYAVEVRNATGLTTSDPALISAGPSTVAPGIAAQPAGATVVAGDSASFTAAATGTAPFAYQWLRDGSPVPAATNAVLTLASALLSDAGSYAVRISNSAGVVTSQAATLTVTAVSRISNLSVLTALGAPPESFTLGYVVGGTGGISKPLVIRAAGPSLAAVGVAGALDDPRLEFFAGTQKVGENDNWDGAGALAAAMAAVGAFPYTGPGSKDAAQSTVATTRENSITISSANATGTGLVLGEIYDATPNGAFVSSTARLLNVSVLKAVGSGLTVGFTMAGGAPKTVLIRAVGPTLAGFGVAGPLLDPQVTLFRSGVSEPVAVNDDWGGGAALAGAFAGVGAFALPAGSRDAALVVSLAPGGYSVVVTGVGGAGGSVLVEVYDAP